MNDTCFEQSLAGHGHLSLSGLIFDVYFIAKLSNVVLSHSLDNVHGHKHKT